MVEMIAMVWLWGADGQRWNGYVPFRSLLHETSVTRIGRWVSCGFGGTGAAWGRP